MSFLGARSPVLRWCEVRGAREKLERAHRDIARRPLATLIGYAIAAELDAAAGAPLTRETREAVLADATARARVALKSLADRGAFRYFGIADRFGLSPEVFELCDVHQIDAIGTVGADVYTIANAVMESSSLVASWRPALGVTAKDLP